jgi:hypothetical protein
MNPKPNAPETLSSHWKPREPSAGSRARLFGPASQVRDYSLTTFLRWIVPATACLFALCVSIVDFKPGARPAAPEVNAGDLGLSNSIERCLSDQSVSPAGGNNRLAQIGRKSGERIPAGAFPGNWRDFHFYFGMDKAKPIQFN